MSDRDDELPNTRPPLSEAVATSPASGPPADLAGMGIVYKARDLETNEVVALKFLKPEIAADTRMLERFKNELRLAHKITHHNVARLYEFHRAGDAACIRPALAKLGPVET